MSDVVLHASAQPIVHHLKVWPEFWGPLEDGSKPFEVRYNDRDFRVGDILRLREWKPAEGGGMFTGREHDRRITYLLTGSRWGLSRDYVVLGLGGWPSLQPES